MGKQIAVKLSRKKEKKFSEFLKGKNSKIILSWSEKRKMNILEDIPPKGPYMWTIYIWNKNFRLKPSFIKIKKEYKSSMYNYAFHTVGKPLIEYSRGQISRIYWEKYFTTNTPEYNVSEFENWYEEIIQWIKKNCKYVEGVYIG